MTVTGGSGLETLLQDAELIGVETPDGPLSRRPMGGAGGKSVAFFPSYDVQHSYHPRGVDGQCVCLNLQQVLREAIEHLPQKRTGPCEHVLKDASFEVK